MDGNFWYCQLKKFLCGLAVLLPLWGISQDSTAPAACGFSDLPLNLLSYPTPSAPAATDLGETYIIPVVVHILYRGTADSINAESVIHQLDVLNEDFGRYGLGSSQNPSAVDCGIRFCLASRDPQGRPSRGINYVKTPLSAVDNSSLEADLETKNVIRWDPARYMNIWVVSSIPGNTAGYSYLPPAAAGKAWDGLVIWYRNFGRNEPHQTDNRYRLGHTTTHEVGHYLNLYHVWGPANNSGCNQDDEVDDTPPCSGQYFATYNNGTMECNSLVQCGQRRMTENYMDYSVDRCLNIYTRGQAERMRSAISVYRSRLVSTQNLVSVGCIDSFYKYNDPDFISFSIFPNPVLGRQLTLNVATATPRKLEMLIVDMTGRIVGQLSLPELSSGDYPVALPPLASGLYRFELFWDGGRKSMNVVVGQP